MAQQILNLDELASLEHRYQSQLPAAELMRRAGLVIADRVCESLEPGKHVVFICGPGNNGGDGFAAARLLLDREYRVTVALIGCDKPKTEDALAMYNAYLNAGGAVISDPYNADKAEVVIDALFGTGMKKPLNFRRNSAAESRELGPHSLPSSTRSRSFFPGRKQTVTRSSRSMKSPTIGLRV